MNGLTESLSGLFGSHSTEVAHFNELCQRCILSRESLQGAIHIEELHGREVRLGFDRNAGVKPSYLPGLVAAALAPSAGTRVIHQHLAHRARCDRQEMRAVMKLKPAIPGELHIDLIDQRGRLQGVTGPFGPQVTGGDAMQFGVQRGDQLIERCFLAGARPFQQFGDHGTHAHQSTVFRPALHV